MSALLLSLVLPAWAANPPAEDGPDANPATDDTPADDSPTPDAPDADAAPDAPESPDAPDTDAPDAPDAPEVEDADAPDAPEADVPDAIEDADLPPVGRNPVPDVMGVHTTIGRHRKARGNRREDRTTMRPYGQLQVFSTVWDQDEDVQADPASYGDPEADPGFQLARARFGFQGRLPIEAGQKSSVDFALQVGVGTPFDVLVVGTQDVGLVDAFLRYGVRTGVGPTSVALGLAKVPFSRDALMSSADLPFMERSVGPANLTNVRDVGLTASQAFVFSGTGDDAPQIVVRAGAYNGNANFLGDQDPGLMYAARVEFAKGDTYRTWNPDKDNAGGIAASVLMNDALSTRTFGWNADGLLRLGPWSLMGEFGRATLTPTDVTVGAPEVVTATTRTSWVASTSVWLGLDGPEGIELAVKASGFDDNLRLKDNGDVLIVHGGALWRNVLPFLDIGAAYIHRQELQGSPISNDTIHITTQIRPAR